MQIEREYPYRPRLGPVLLGMLFFIAAAVMLAMRAATNREGLLINHVIPLSPGQATGFYWVLFVFCLGILALGGTGLYHRLIYRQRLAFTPEGLLVPKARWSGEELFIPYRSITALETVEAPGGQHHLYVVHAAGRQIINSGMLPDKQTFLEIRQYLGNRVTVAP